MNLLKLQDLKLKKNQNDFVIDEDKINGKL